MPMNFIHCNLYYVDKVLSLGSCPQQINKSGLLDTSFEKGKFRYIKQVCQASGQTVVALVTIAVI